MKKLKFKLYFLLFIIFLIIPIGLISSYSAWGEWELNYFKEKIGYIPQGILKYNDILKPIFSDYTFIKSMPIFSYYISAIIGVLTIFTAFYLIKLLKK